MYPYSNQWANTNTNKKNMDINAGILCMMLVSDMSALFLNNILNSFKGNIGNCYPLKNRS